MLLAAACAIAALLNLVPVSHLQMGGQGPQSESERVECERVERRPVCKDQEVPVMSLYVNVAYSYSACKLQHRS